MKIKKRPWPLMRNARQAQAPLQASDIFKVLQKQAMSGPWQKFSNTSFVFSLILDVFAQGWHTMYFLCHFLIHNQKLYARVLDQPHDSGEPGYTPRYLP